MMLRQTFMHYYPLFYLHSFMCVQIVFLLIERMNYKVLPKTPDLNTNCDFNTSDILGTIVMKIFSCNSWTLSNILETIL